MMCWVINSDLTPVWNGVHKLPDHMDFGWKRQAVIDNNGTVWLHLRQWKDGKKVQTVAHDENPNDRTDPKLVSLRGDAYKLTDLVVSGDPLRDVSIRWADNGLELVATIKKGSSKDPKYEYQLYIVNAEHALTSIYSEPVSGVEYVSIPEAVPCKSGGWYALYRSDAGLTVSRLNSKGEKQWGDRLDRYKHYWSNAFEWNSELFLSTTTQAGALKDYANGKDMDPRGNAFMLVPAYVRVSGKGKNAVGPIFPVSSGAERDVLIHGFPGFSDAATSGWFMEPSRDDKRPGVVAVKIP
jgi:hypothetical protein